MLDCSPRPSGSDSSRTQSKKTGVALLFAKAVHARTRDLGPMATFDPFVKRTRP